MKSAVIVGANGQDGRLLANLLETKGYRVLEVTRSSLDSLSQHEVTNYMTVQKPDEIYYLAAYHHSSQDSPTDNDGFQFEHSYNIHVLGLIHFLEAILKVSSKSRLFYAASSLVFGAVNAEKCDEFTPMSPTTPYGITKLMGLHICRYYRTKYALFASVGILFNHESKLRQSKFLSKKIVNSIKEILAGKIEKLALGDLGAEVDWGYAPDYVEAMRLILMQPAGNDFIVATGIKHTVQEFVIAAFGAAGLDWTKHVQESSCVLTRKNGPLVGDPSKLMSATGWKPTVTFEQMIGKLLD